jgi:hypothetical protein
LAQGVADLAASSPAPTSVVPTRAGPNAAVEYREREFCAANIDCKPFQLTRSYGTLAYKLGSMPFATIGAVASHNLGLIIAPT